MLIFACDPGGRSGWATYSIEEELFEGGQLNNTEGHHLELWNLLGKYYNAYCGLGADSMIIVTESFEFRNDVDTEDRRKGLELVSRDYIGVMKLFSQMHDIKLVQQMPSHALSFVTDEKLKKLELLHEPVSSVYNKDYNAAAKHLIFFMVAKLKIKEGIVDKWKRKD